MPIMIRTLALAALVFLNMLTAARAFPYVFDPDHTDITFTVNHLGFSTIHGRFRKYDMQIDLDPDNIEAAQVVVTIDASSLDTNSRLRDDHTMNYPGLLDVVRFPTITFRSTEIVLTSAETVRMTGDLTIRDVTRPVSFDVRLNARGVTPLSQGKEVLGFTATGKIDRVAFGMSFAAPAVSAIIPVRIDVEITRAE